MSQTQRAPDREDSRGWDAETEGARGIIKYCFQELAREQGFLENG